MPNGSQREERRKRTHDEHFQQTPRLPPLEPCPLYLKGLHPLVLAGWAEELEALPERKRAKWGTRLTSKLGVIHKVRFHNGYFQIKMDASQQQAINSHPAGGWAPIVPLREQPAYEQILEAYGEKAAEDCRTGNIRESPTGRLDMSDEEARSEMGLVVGHHVVVNAIAESHTGQHHRNKTLAVPTAAGEPVRG